VVDITTPGSPAIVGSVDTGTANGVAVSGSYAYVADELAGLQVVDITTPATPALVGGADTPGGARGVAVSGSYAYVADAGTGLLVVDITTPASPVVVGGTDTPGEARGVAVSGSYAYIADTNFGLQILAGQCQPATAVTVPPFKASLRQNFPNPFHPATTIDYTLGERSRAVVGIYDAAGRLVARLDQGTRDAGDYRVEWDGRDDQGNVVGSGVYFYRIEGAPGVAAKKMVRLK
jgi:hypothetical protein